MGTSLIRAGARDPGLRPRRRRDSRTRSGHHPRGSFRLASKRCPATARSAAAWRSCWAAPRPVPRRSSRPRFLTIGAHRLGVAPEAAIYRDGGVIVAEDPPARAIAWDAIVEIAHRKFHQLPPGHGAGASGDACLGSADRRGASHGGRTCSNVPVLCLRGPCGHTREFDPGHGASGLTQICRPATIAER